VEVPLFNAMFLNNVREYRNKSYIVNNNNNNYDNVYGAVIIARVHPVHLMNADWAPGGRQPSDQTNRFELWVCRSAVIIRRHRRHLLLLSS